MCMFMCLCFLLQQKRWAALSQAGLGDRLPMICWPRRLCCDPASPATPVSPSESPLSHFYAPPPRLLAPASRTRRGLEAGTHPRSSPGSRHLCPWWRLWWAYRLPGPDRSQQGQQQFPPRGSVTGMQRRPSLKTCLPVPKRWCWPHAWPTLLHKLGQQAVMHL